MTHNNEQERLHVHQVECHAFALSVILHGQMISYESMPLVVEQVIDSRKNNKQESGGEGSLNTHPIRITLTTSGNLGFMLWSTWPARIVPITEKASFIQDCR